MARDDMHEHIYDNTKWMKKSYQDPKYTCEDRKFGSEKRNCIFTIVLSVLLFLSLLANGVLIYLYFETVEKTENNLQCQPETNCSISDNEGSISCTYEEDWMSLNYCPDLPEQWFKGKGSFYVFSSNNRTWDSSRKRCRNLGGDLVIINNTEKKEFLAQRQCITGVSDFYWARKHDINSHEGKDSKQDNCFVLKGNKQEDVSCLREERSICEIPCLQ